MSRPAILFCSQAAHVGGGVETWLESLDRALTARGWRVVVALARGRFHDPDRYRAHHHHPETIELDGRSGLREERIGSLLEAFESIEPDIVVPVNLVDALAAASWAKSRGSPLRIVTCIHSQHDDRLEQIRSFARFVDLATSVSRRMFALLQTIIEDPARTAHIPTGVPEPASPSPPRDHLRRLLFAGRLDPGEKRAVDIIQLVRGLSVSAVIVEIAGEGPARAMLEEQLAAETASGKVVFRGSLTRNELYTSVYPRADALILFSEAEAGPIVAWEAMVHGVVPIVSDFVGREEEGVLRDGFNAIVFPVGDVATAVRVVLRCTAPGSLTPLSSEAMRIPAEYREPQFARRWDAVLRRCLELPAVIGTGRDLPPLVSPGRLARFGLGGRAMRQIRRMAGRRYEHAEPGSEWPH
ncbi:MAG TPA: glycosyltransferase family 4 protein [Thermoanaerobaculia bacterium]|nr:glycosyltransferase family 4 protein [Thermoanaerobaculia bacterium]